MDSIPLSEIEKTKKQFLVLVTGEYLITGFFWVFLTLGSIVLFKGAHTAQAVRPFFFSMFVLMFSNGLWEMLTGWYADKFRRQYSMSAGFMACLIGFLFMGAAVFIGYAESVISPTAIVWNIGISIWSLGPALLSGAQEAWLVDRCNFYSEDPPEDLDDVFKKSAAYGVVAKSTGAAACFIIFWLIFYQRGAYDAAGRPDMLVFIISASVAALLSFLLFRRSRSLREEYWSHPKYQTNESLYAFIREGLRDLCRRPLRWFAVSYVCVMSINYVLSTTIWPYLYVSETSATPAQANQATLPHVSGETLRIAAILIVAEILGSFLSKRFSDLIDLIKQQRLRIPVASLAYLAPLPFVWIYSQESYRGGRFFLYTLIFAAALFRIAHASVFGSLNTIGQLAIKSDERRAILISIASAVSSFLMSIVFILFYWFSTIDAKVKIDGPIEDFWVIVPAPFIVFLLCSGYLAARPRAEGK